MTKYLNDFRDENNSNLIEIIESNKIHIVLKYEPNLSTWMCDVTDRQNKVAEIIYNNERPQTFGYFTHELFHIHLFFINNFWTTGELITSNLSFNDYPIGHINNIIAHRRFYCDFINLGYQHSEFYCDYKNENTKSNNDIKKIEEAFNKNCLINDSINTYLSSFFSFVFNPDNPDRYSNQMNDLYKMSPQLFKILKDHWDTWDNSENYDNSNFFTLLFTDINSWRNCIKKMDMFRTKLPTLAAASFFLNSWQKIRVN